MRVICFNRGQFPPSDGASDRRNLLRTKTKVLIFLWNLIY
jgi:hypothetical protein